MNEHHSVYPVVFRDCFGTESTQIVNDGKTLTMIVRGVEFRGDDWDAFEPVVGADLTEANFNRHQGALCSCEIEAVIDLPIVAAGQTEIAQLRVVLALGDPAPNGGLDNETLKLFLTCDEIAVQSRGTSGWFEDELLDLQRQLPPNHYIKCCFNCAFSDYSPAGHGLYGGLACFRDDKLAYREVKTKRDLFRVWELRTEYVQETHLCPDFEKRSLGTGYRG